jgi:hypothetical protein
MEKTAPAKLSAKLPEQLVLPLGEGQGRGDIRVSILQSGERRTVGIGLCVTAMCR